MTSTSEAAGREVLVRAADAGDTYVTWRWRHRIDDPKYQPIPQRELDAVMTRLRQSLVQQDSKSGPGSVQHAVTSGEFATVTDEAKLTRAITSVVLPQRLSDEIMDQPGPVRVRLTPSPALAYVPWELLHVSKSQRLIEVATIYTDPPATLNAARSVTLLNWDEVRARPPLYVIDPVLNGTQRLKRPLERDDEGNRLFEQHLRSRRRWLTAEYRGSCTRVDLKDRLAEPCSRLLYLGHMSAQPDEPGTAALHLSDVGDCYGLLEYLSAAPPRARHRPFSALDLLFGTELTDKNSDWKSLDVRGKVWGADIWPMPPRVGLIACEGGADFRSAETFGIVMAVLNAGAQLVTTTRWPLPTDLAIDEYCDSPLATKVRPMVNFALTVDTAHEQDDPVAYLAQWQREQLDLWRRHDAIAYTPLVWASLINVVAPSVARFGSTGMSADRYECGT